MRQGDQRMGVVGIKHMERMYRKNKDKLLDLRDAAIEFLDLHNTRNYDYNYFISNGAY